MSRIVDVTTDITTSDMYFAAYLIVLDRELVSVSKSGNRVLFTFVTPAKSEDHASWVSGTGEVSAKRYSDAIRTCKSTVHDFAPRNMDQR